jgi:hypothetical protein
MLTHRNPVLNNRLFQPAGKPIEGTISISTLPPEGDGRFDAGDALDQNLHGDELSDFNCHHQAG